MYGGDIYNCTGTSGKLFKKSFLQKSPCHWKTRGIWKCCQAQGKYRGYCILTQKKGSRAMLRSLEWYPVSMCECPPPPPQTTFLISPLILPPRQPHPPPGPCYVSYRAYSLHKDLRVYLCRFKGILGSLAWYLTLKCECPPPPFFSPAPPPPPPPRPLRTSSPVPGCIMLPL